MQQIVHGLAFQVSDLVVCEEMQRQAHHRDQPNRQGLNPNPLTGQLDQDLLSLHQFLVDIPFSNSLKLRVGKQEYSFGLERFIATREGPNTRTPYYGVNLKYQRKNLQWDAFVSHPIKIKPGVFDDGPTDEILGGFLDKLAIFAPGVVTV